jgi:hypothetical protein
MARPVQIAQFWHLIWLKQTVRIERSKWSNVIRHPPFADSMMLSSEEVRRPLQRPVSFLLQVRYNMSTILIVLLVLFLLGGGGWGYSRYRG